jgi:outer membrane cobalamin receptor
MLCVLVAPASAQSRPDLATATLEDLMKITVTTASRNAETVAEAAAMVEVVSARQIQVRGYRSLADLLKDQLQMKADIGKDPDYPNQFTVMGSRGTSRVVLLLDGIRVSSPTGEPLPIMNNYPIHNVRQVEIVYGPASALYGADAFSAVVNIISNDAADVQGVSLASSGGQFGMINQTASYRTRLRSRASLAVSGQWFRDAQADLNDAYPDLFKGMQAQRTGLFDTIFGPMSPDGPVFPDYEAPLAAHSAHALLRAGGLQVTLFQTRSRASTSPPNTPDNAVYNAAANR